MWQQEYRASLFKKSLIRVIILLGASIFTVIFLAASWLYVCQEKLIFKPVTTSEARQALISSIYSNAREYAIKASDNILLRGWIIENPSPRSPLLIYFGGNKNLASEVLKYSSYFENWNFISVNYRGFGLSEGKPAEKYLYRDALEIYDEVKNILNIDTERIVIMGYSLGTGIATYVAEKRPVAGVILAAPFDNLANLAAGYVKCKAAGLLVRQRFDSLSRAPGISAPLMVLTAKGDKVVPNKNSMKLVSKWRGPAQVICIKDRKHKDLLKDYDCWRAIQKFLEGLP